MVRYPLLILILVGALCHGADIVEISTWESGSIFLDATIVIKADGTVTVTERSRERIGRTDFATFAAGLKLDWIAGYVPVDRMPVVDEARRDLKVVFANGQTAQAWKWAGEKSVAYDAVLGQIRKAVAAARFEPVPRK